MKQRRYNIQVLRGEGLVWNNPRIPFNPYIVVASGVNTFRTAVVFNSESEPKWSHKSDFVTEDGEHAEIEIQLWTMGYRGGECLAEATLPLADIIAAGVGVSVTKTVPLSPASNVFLNLKFVNCLIVFDASTWNFRFVILLRQAGRGVFGGSLVCELSCWKAHTSSAAQHHLEGEVCVFIF